METDPVILPRILVGSRGYLNPENVLSNPLLPSERYSWLGGQPESTVYLWEKSLGGRSRGVQHVL